MFDFRLITPILFGITLLKHKMTICSKNCGRPWPRRPPWLRLWCRNRLWARGTCLKFNFTLDYETYASNQSIVATYRHVDVRAYCTLLGCMCVFDHIKINKQRKLELLVFMLFSL